MRALFIRVFLIVVGGPLLFFSASGKSYEENINDHLEQFTSYRNDIKPAKKLEARNKIINKFKDIGLDTWTENFTCNQIVSPGMHIVGRVKGKYTGTSKDRILIIGAHYDTVDTSDGVNDNGSGMAALLQAAQIYMDKKFAKCPQDFTILFVAFDKEEKQPACRQESLGCQDERRLCGSYHFVKNLTSYIKQSKVGSVQGAFVMDTILNFDTTPDSQHLPTDPFTLFPEAFNKTIKENDNRGDFLAVIGRKSDDNELRKAFMDNFEKGKYKVLDMPLPFDGRLRDQSEKLRGILSDFFLGAHYRFWNGNNSSLPAVLLTDTAEFRGYMKNCYHSICDDMDSVTSDMITFMTKTANALVKAAQELTRGGVCKPDGLDFISCGDKVTIQTTGYPNGYYNDVNESVVGILNGSQYNYLIEFDDLDLEESMGCKNDYVELTTISQDGRVVDKARYCKTIPKAFYSHHRIFQVRFVSDGFKTKKGFRLTFTRIARATRGYEGSQSLITVAAILSLIAVYFD